ncbi:MAG: hypothetical protein RQ760_15655 [Sedimentisphaerales bacterium]|nr:hypothetical protein [Sedimentisphaerales bacterium]
MKIIITLLVGMLALGGAELSAQTSEAENSQIPVVIVVVGAAGTPEYEAQFTEWAGFWEKACLKGHVKYISIGLDKTDGSSDRVILQDILMNESKQTTAALWFVLIGHGTFDGRVAKFNLRGPDISADNLADWLKPFQRPVAVINAASSSAPFLSKLSAQQRVIITATKGGFEQNYARFGKYLSDSIANPKADLDKDGQTSLLEAFLTASNRVDEFYSASGRLITEHALLDDNGDGLGTRADWFRGIRPIQKARDGASLDGYRAHQFYLVYSEDEMKMAPSLRAQRDDLELKVMKLRDSREIFSEDEYFSKLEELLSNIAQIYEQTENAGNTQ